MINVFKKVAMTVVTTAAVVSMSNTYAANWLMLQGTEPEASAGRAKVWGFVQFQYQKDESEPNQFNGAYIPPKMIGPNLTSQEQFNVNRARLGVRGTGMPLDPKVNYFLLTEFGNNAITAANGGGAMVTDASITLNHIPGVRVRLGLFKTPSAEEGLQAIHVFDYINFTTVTNQLLLERFPNAKFTNNASGSDSFNQFEKPVGAFRDVGVQVFDAFRIADWELSYAVMTGNGNGLAFGDDDANKDKYGYFSAEWVLGNDGGPRRPGLKMFIWKQAGKRMLDNTGSKAVPWDSSTWGGNAAYDPAWNAHDPKSYDRTRQGFGIKYAQGMFHASMEMMKGKGMIFVGPDKPTFDMNGVDDPATAAVEGGGSNVGNGATGKASGGYLDFGVRIPNTGWQFDVRYDVYNRLTDDVLETEWKTATLGVNYHLNKKSRITANISNTSVEAVNFPAPAPGQNPNNNLDGVGKRYAFQVTHIF